MVSFSEVKHKGNPMNIYQMRHAILAQHRGGRVTPAQLKAELLENSRDTVFVMSTVSKGAINERGTSRTEEL